MLGIVILAPKKEKVEMLFEVGSTPVDALVCVTSQTQLKTKYAFI